MIAPHMDDEVLGVGGTICRHIEKKDLVRVCFVCNRAYGHKYVKKFIKTEKENALEAKNILGYQEHAFLDMNDERLDAGLIEAIISIEKAVKGFKPNIAYIPHRGDNNQDHRAVFEASMVALRSFSSPYVREIHAYECPSSTEQSSPSRENIFVPNRYSDITQFMHKKKEALNCYQREKREFPHPRSIRAIEAWAMKRGAEAYLKYAESFEVVRIITR